MFGWYRDGDMKDIKVSIITVCYNSEKTIERTIKSVLDQTYKNIEYLIIDGASTDGTMDIVNPYRAVFGERLKVVSEKDDGIYFAMNKGIDLSTGELIGIINSDDWYEKDAVEKVIRAYEADHDNKYTVYYGKTAIVQDGKVIQISMSDHNRLEEKMISHPSCFVTKEAYTKLGAYNTKYVSVADYDLMLRYKRTGKVSFVPLDAHIANFTMGGMSSTGKAYIDLLRLKMDYGTISKAKGKLEIFKAKLAMNMEKRGLKPIQIRKM